MLGPSPVAQDRTCVAGQACRLTDLAVFGGGGRWALLDTCGASGAAQAIALAPESLAAADGELLWADALRGATGAGGVWHLHCPGSVPAMRRVGLQVRARWFHCV